MVSTAQHLLDTTTGHIEFVRAIGKAGDSNSEQFRIVKLRACGAAVSLL